MSDPASERTTIRAIETAVVGCERCPELRRYTADVARVKRRAYLGDTYWGRPVPAFGDAAARCVLVGLAPGAHGSNRTGRMFTGDASGVWLYRALHRAGFASQAESTHAGDGLTLRDCFITAALRCAPPGNRPTPGELRNCAPYLDEEFAALRNARIVVGLGAIGTRAALEAFRRLGYGGPPLTFAHGVAVELRRVGKVREGSAEERTITILASYHPSRQNTQTGRLSEAMFDSVFSRVRDLLDVLGPL